MERRRRKRVDLSQIDLKKAGAAIVVAALILLIALLCITISMRAHIQDAYTSARNEVGEQLYTELYMLCQTFDQVTVPGQDVQNVVIPTMQEYYLAARTLNEALTNAFGERYEVLSVENLSSLDGAFEAYDTAFRTGKSTDDAQATMDSCMGMVRSVLDSRFRDGKLRAA